METEREAWLKLTIEAPIDPDLPICDPHHHLWDRPNDRYLLEELLEDTGGGHRIVQTVFVECKSRYKKDGPEEMQPVGETEFVQGIADQVARGQYGVTAVASGIVGYADLSLGNKVAPVLEAHIAASKNRFRGIRHISVWTASPADIMASYNAPKGLLLDPKFREGFACLQKYGLSFDAWLYFPQLMELVDLARAFPEIAIVVDHIGGLVRVGPYVGKNDEVFRDWKHGISALAACPNVSVKLGGLGTPRCGFGWYEQAAPPSSDEVAKGLAPYFNWCIEQFGVERCMFESNFPVDKISFSYTVMWNAFKRLSKDFTPQERAALFHDTATKVYQLPTR
ncbi:MAG: amidohydrolase family protein [Dehalococcoidales bacterium]